MGFYNIFNQRKSETTSHNFTGLFSTDAVKFIKYSREVFFCYSDPVIRNPDFNKLPAVSCVYRNRSTFPIIFNCVVDKVVQHGFHALTVSMHRKDLCVYGDVKGKTFLFCFPGH